MERAIVAVVAGVLGTAFGSFLNVVVHRVPLKLSIVRPPSACPGCGEPIRPRDNVPIVSYLLLRGRCRHCGARISIRYPAIELLTGLVFAAAFLRFSTYEEAAFACAASAVLIALSFIDLEHRRVPNVIVLPASAAAALWVVGAGLATDQTSVIVNSLASGVAGFVLLFVIAIVSGGMGFGDVKLALFIGLVTGRFGWEAFVFAIFAGFVTGGLISVVLLVSRARGRKDAIPFAPSLCVGALAGLFAQAGPVEAWLGL